TTLLACAAYVDLNPVRAAMAETLEASDHTSVQRRLAAVEHAANDSSGISADDNPVGDASNANSQLDDGGGESPEKAHRPRVTNSADENAGERKEGDSSRGDSTGSNANRAADRLSTSDNMSSHDGFLSPLFLDERNGALGPCASSSGRRCSDKGFLPMTPVEYVELLDWTARQAASGKRGRTPDDLPPVLERLGIAGEMWFGLATNFGRLFSTVAGPPIVVDEARTKVSRRRFHMTPAARELYENVSG
ncbi:hypothetical protein ACFL2H_09000, partial [Planctomycetota bacterium]